MRIQPLSDEFLLVKHGQGLKYIAPDYHSVEQKNVVQLGHVIKLPSSVYIAEKSDSRFVYMNEYIPNLIGYPSVKDILGRNVKQFSDKANAHKVLSNDKNVTTNEKLLIVEEKAKIKTTGEHVQALTFKMPFYHPDETLFGVFGISIFYGKHSFAELLTEIVQLGLLSNPMLAGNMPRTTNNQVNLTRREKQVFENIAKGFSARLIAEKLLISVRTIEHHIENIKVKLGAKNKYELVEIYHSRED